MRRKTISITALLLALLLSLTACKSGTDASKTENGTTKTADASQETLDDEQTLNLILGVNVSILDPQSTSWVQESLITSHIFEGLYRIAVDENENEYWALAGAESYEVSDDEVTYTYHLRDNFWSDGEPVKAQDYVDAFIRELTPENGFSAISSYDYVKNGKAFYAGEASADDLGIKAIDDKTLEITFENAEGITDPEEVIHRYKEIEDKLVGEAFVGPIYWGDTRYFQQSYVKNITYRQLSANFDFTHAYITAH